MNVITFQSRFEQPIMGGVKTSTIRGRRRDGKPRAVAGEIASLRVWTGRPYGSPQRELVKVRVERVRRVDLESPFPDLWVDVAGSPLSPREVEALARREGFGSWMEMKDWFDDEHGLPFSGVLIEWGPL